MILLKFEIINCVARKQKQEQHFQIVATVSCFKIFHHKTF